MTLLNDENVILNVMKKKPDLGKTALMKIVYMLQQVEHVELKYDFEMYTYGPYSSEVLESIEELEEKGLLRSEMYPYGNYVGYQLNISEKGEEALRSLDAATEQSVDDILAFSDGKSARDLELLATIIFISGLYHRNKLGSGQDEVVKKVREIKPHFDKAAVSAAYEALKEKSYVSV